jgi:UDP:flavonoid glycosyltransferase YjiC (YdhE family)
VSTVAFLNIGMHGRVNPTLPVVAELVRRGHSVTYHTSPAFRAEIEAAGATVCLYSGGEQPLPDPPTPVALLEGLARTAVRVLPSVLTDLRDVSVELVRRLVATMLTIRVPEPIA